LKKTEKRGGKRGQQKGSIKIEKKKHSEARRTIFKRGKGRREGRVASRQGGRRRMREKVRRGELNLGTGPAISSRASL